MCTTVRDRTVDRLEQLLEEVKGITSSDNSLLAAIRKLFRTYHERTTAVATVFSWYNSAKSTRLQRVIHTQPILLLGKKSLYIKVVVF